MRCAHSVLLSSMILANAAQSQIAKDHLAVEAKIESTRYCRVNSTKASLEIRFRFALKNTTSGTLTIYQPMDAVTFVSRTLQDAQHGKYQMTLYGPDTFGIRKAGDIVPVTKNTSRQTNVKPGEMFTGETAEEQPIPIALNRKFPRWEALEPGRYFVQLMAGSEIKGTETFVQIMSQPIEMTVDKHPKVEKCP